MINWHCDRLGKLLNDMELDCLISERFGDVIYKLLYNFTKYEKFEYKLFFQPNCIDFCTKVMNLISVYDEIDYYAYFRYKGEFIDLFEEFFDRSTYLSQSDLIFDNWNIYMLLDNIVIENDK